MGREGRVLRGDVDHAPWRLQRAEVRIQENTMADPLGLDLTRPPDHACFSRRVEVTAAPLVVSVGAGSLPA